MEPNFQVVILCRVFMPLKIYPIVKRIELEIVGDHNLKSSFVLSIIRNYHQRTKRDFIVKMRTHEFSVSRKFNLDQTV